MLPYTWFQLGYAGMTLAVGVGLWCLSARVPGLRAHPRLRFAAIGAALLGVALFVAALFDTGFAAVAVAYYGAALALPVLIFAQQCRAPRKDALLLAAACLTPALAAYAAFIAPNDLQVIENDLSFAAWPAQALPFTIVQISDLQTVGPCARQDEAVARINELSPDLIAVCGDYLAGPFHQPKPAIDAARAFLGALRAKHGIVCVKGHSETRALREQVFAGLELRYLDDQEFTLDLAPGQRLRVIGLGLDEPRFETRREAGLLTVAIGHVPDQSRMLIGREVDLHLAGHTHGGQIVVPGYGAPITLSRLPRSFARGLFRFGDHWLSVNPGIGMEGHHAPRVRLFCPPEIDVLSLAGGGVPFIWSEPPIER
jgi:predicted MPP superfamily phosphohydrolase